MLFTSESAVATNVVTLGDMEIALEEWTDEDLTPSYTVIPTPGEDAEYKEVGLSYDNDGNVVTTGGTTFTGITFPDKLVPNAIISKAPRVVHKGGVDAWLRVKATLVVRDEDGELLTFASEESNSISEDVQELIFDILASGKQTDNWKQIFDVNSLVDYEAVKVPQAYYYYVDDSVLARFSESAGEGAEWQGETEPIFYGLQVENYPTENNITAFAGLNGYTISLELQAQAVQAEWNGSPEDASNQSKWADFFSELETA
jgi:hypothetical protein